MVGRWLALAVPVLLLIATIAAFVATQRSVHDQEHRILRERTAEVELVVRNAIANVPAMLRSLGTAARLGADPARAFLAEARAATPPSGPAPQLALVRMRGSGPVVVASTGGAPARGTQLAGPRAAAVRAALRSPQLTATPVFSDGDRRLLAFAIGPPAAPAGTVVLQQTPVSPRASPVGQEDAFHEIKAVVYGTPVARRDQIVVATTAETLARGDVARGHVDVGDQRWLLLTAAREPLVGGGAAAVPWIVLAAGLIGALLTAAVIWTLLRRRDYALTLVGERTAELRASLAALESAQSRLMAEERLAAVGRVAAAVGHELRAPLGALTGALSRVRARVVDGQRDAARTEIDAVEDEAARAAQIVESLLDYAREREPAATDVDLEAILEEALAVTPVPRGVEVRRDIDTVGQVHADRRQLRQVLLNVLSNGYDAMGDGGTLTVGARREGDRAIVRIADSGRGMDARTSARAFEPFFTTKEGAIGLGLPVARRIVEMHGGTIQAESENGRGTAIVLTVPLAAPPVR